MMQTSSEPISYAASEIPHITGFSRRSTRRVLREIGRKVGGRRVVLKADLEAWIRAQPRVADETPATPGKE